MGEPPRVAYLTNRPGSDNSIWHRVHRSPVTLPFELTKIARFRRGLIVYQSAEAATVAILDAHGAVTRSFPADDAGLGVSQTRQLVAWAGYRGKIWLAVERTGKTRSLGRFRDVTDVPAIWGAGGCARLFESSGCRVLVNHAGKASSLGASGSPSSLPDTIRAYDAASIDGETSPGLVQLGSRCWAFWAVWDSPTWQTCDQPLVSFSASGRRVLSYRASRVADLDIRLFDDTGGYLAAFGVAADSNMTVVQAEWETNSQVLAVVRASHGWAVLRLGVDGSIEYAVPPTPGRLSMHQPRFVLAAR